MTQSVFDIAMLILCFYGAYRAILAISIWRNQTSARTVDAASLSADFHGIILFSLDGGFEEIQSASSAGRILFTKNVEKDQSFRFRIDVTGAQISDARIEEFLKRVRGLAGGEVSLRSVGEGDLVGEIQGPLASNYQALESVTRSLISSLGFDSDAKFKFKSGGPSDHDEVKEYFGLKNSSEKPEGGNDD